MVHRSVLLQYVLIVEAAVIIALCVATIIGHDSRSLFSLSHSDMVGLVGATAVVTIAGLMVLLSARSGLTKPLEAAKKQTETMHHRTRMLLAGLDILTDGFVQTDRAGRIVHANSVFDEMSGVDQRDYVGQTLSAMFVVEYAGARRPASYLVDEVVRAGAAVDSGPLAQITPINAKPFTGRVFAAPTFDQRGQVIGTSITLHRRSALESVKADEAPVQAAHDPFELRAKLVLDPSGRIIDCDTGATRLFSATPDQLRGRSAGELITLQSLPKALSGDTGAMTFVQHCLAEPPGQVIDVMAWRPKGQAVMSEMVVEPADERPSGSGALLDGFQRIHLHLRMCPPAQIDEKVDALRKQLEGLKGELEDAQAALSCATVAHSMMLADISEDLRTPLDVVIGYSEMLVEDTHSQGLQDVSADLAKIEASGKRLLRLANEMMDLSLILGGKVELWTHAFDLGLLTREVVKVVQPQLKTRGQELTVDYHDPGEIGVGGAGGSSMYTDRTKLMQALATVVTSASRETCSKQLRLKVDFESDRSGRWATFCVLGAPTDYQSQQAQSLLDNVRDMDEMSVSTGTGSALELEIAGRLCRLLGGGLSIERRTGEETSFTIRVPAQAADSRTTIRPTASSAASH